MAVPEVTSELLDLELLEEEWGPFVRNTYGWLKKVGDNPQGSDPDVTARLARIEADVAALGSTGLLNLRVINDPVSPNSKLLITADTIAVNGTLLRNVSVPVDITVAGAGGLDAGSEAANTWYSVYLGVRLDTMAPVGVVSTSATAPSTAHVSINGIYTKFRRVTRVFNDGSSNFRRFVKHDHWCSYEGGSPSAFGSNIGATDEADNTPSNCQDYFPPGVSWARLFFRMSPQSPGAVVLSVRRGAADTYTPVLSVPDGDVAGVVVQYAQCEVGLDASRNFQWMANVAPNANLTAGISLGPSAFYDPS